MSKDVVYEGVTCSACLLDLCARSQMIHVSIEINWQSIPGAGVSKWGTQGAEELSVMASKAKTLQPIARVAYVYSV